MMDAGEQACTVDDHMMSGVDGVGTVSAASKRRHSVYDVNVEGSTGLNTPTRHTYEMPLENLAPNHAPRDPTSEGCVDVAPPSDCIYEVSNTADTDREESITLDDETTQGDTADCIADIPVYLATRDESPPACCAFDGRLLVATMPNRCESFCRQSRRLLQRRTRRGGVWTTEWAAADAAVAGAALVDVFRQRRPPYACFEAAGEWELRWRGLSQAPVVSWGVPIRADREWQDVPIADSDETASPSPLIVHTPDKKTYCEVAWSLGVAHTRALYANGVLRVLISKHPTWSAYVDKVFNLPTIDE